VCRGLLWPAQYEKATSYFISRALTFFAAAPEGTANTERLCNGVQVSKPPWLCVSTASYSRRMLTQDLTFSNNKLISRDEGMYTTFTCLFFHTKRRPVLIPTSSTLSSRRSYRSFSLVRSSSLILVLFLIYLSLFSDALLLSSLSA
jgi:hypothetical protein